MSSGENRGFSSLISLFRAIFGARREQGSGGEGDGSSGINLVFQRFVSERFREFANVEITELLSIAWIKKLLELYISCQDIFRLILIEEKSKDKFVSDFFQRSLTGLDICNATRDGLQRIHRWHKCLEILSSALDSRQGPIGDGQFHRARKSLAELTISMLDTKASGSVLSPWNKLFGRLNLNTSKDQASTSLLRAGRGCSSSWTVSPSWSAVKELQAIADNLNPPRSADLQASGGLLVSVSTMNYVLGFVLWVLVAAIPCQGRGLQVKFTIPRQCTWGAPLVWLYEHILEESKKKERKNSRGLLKEIYEIEKCANDLPNLVVFKCPLTEEQKTVVEQERQRLTLLCDALQSGIDPLERQMRELFKSIVKLRTECHDRFVID